MTEPPAPLTLKLLPKLQLPKKIAVLVDLQLMVARTQHVCLIIGFAVFLPLKTAAFAEDVAKVEHQIDIAHPIHEDGTFESCTLTQFNDENGYPIGYAMPIETEVCRDEVCQLATVTIYWDELGNYQRLELPLGQELTKKDHTPFTRAEYQRLDRILGDKTSVLRGFKIDEITSGPVKERVDGVTGATVLTVKEATVESAAYTTYTLWHWVNGDPATRIDGFTRAANSSGFVQRLLRTDSLQHTRFALELIDEQFADDGQFADLVLTRLSQCDRPTTFDAIAYLENSSGDKHQLHASLVDVFQDMDPARKLYIIEYLFDQNEVADSTLSGLTASFDGMPYYPIHRVLSLIESQDATTDAVQANVAKLLSHDNFFIARRAYEHLVDQEVDEDVRKTLSAFFERHSDRL